MSRTFAVRLRVVDLSFVATGCHAPVARVHLRPSNSTVEMPSGWPCPTNHDAIVQPRAGRDRGPDSGSAELGVDRLIHDTSLQAA